MKLIRNAFVVGAGVVAAGAMQTAIHQHGASLNSLSAALQTRRAPRMHRSLERSGTQNLTQGLRPR
jgi:hypothetical protein